MITIIGIEYRKYKSKKTGKEVEGYNIHVTDDTPMENLDGISCYSEWVNPRVFADLGVKVGDKGWFNHNRFGSVDAFSSAV